MHSDKAVQSPTPLRRWWTGYSLRTFFIVVTLVCVWVGWEANRARRQGEAVREVERLGGVVHFDHQYDEKGSFQSDREPYAPVWLREALGEEHFRHVVVLDLSYGGPRSGANRITNERLALIAGLPDLTTLELGRELGITDEGLVHLRRLKKLKTLYLYNTSVEGSGLRHLRGLEKLENLNLLGTPLSDEGLCHLAELPRLRSLVLSGTRITDDGLKELGSLRSLRDLQLNDADITDAGLEHLKRLSAATSISVHRTHVTAKAVSQLQESLPKCTVTPSVKELSRKPVELSLWPQGHRPTAAELMARAKELGVDLHVGVDVNRPGQPIVSLSLHNSDVSAASLIRLLAEAPELELLNLRDLVDGDNLVRKMPVLPDLRYVSLNNCRITDAALPHLSKQTKLRDLYLEENFITDSGLALLKSLANLERLSLSNNRVTYKARLELKRARPQWQVPL